MHNNQSITPMGRKLQGIYCDCSLSQREAFADAKAAGTRGFDFDTLEDDLNYGGNIYRLR
jgi:hypothetical protein